MRVFRHVGWMVLVLGCGDEFSVGSGGATASSASATSASASASASSATSTAATTTSGSTSVSSASGTGVGTSTGSTTSGSSSSGVVVCDVDQDGAPVDVAGCCMVPSACDCDDDDPDVFPGQVAFFDDARPSVQDPVLKWDYDCDGLAEKQYVFVDNPCAMLGSCSVSGLSFRSAMGGDDCGTVGVVTDCQGLLAVCASQAGTQGCH